MPNHITQIVGMKGTKKDIEAVRALMDVPEEGNAKGESFNFRQVIPMPESFEKADGWYHWSVANWGTKWNSYDVEWKSDNVIRLDTAWSIPQPVYRALAEKFPNVKFFVFFADEDRGSNCGLLVLNGDEETYFNPEDVSAGTAITFANTMHGDDYDTIKEWTERMGYSSLKEAKSDYSDEYINNIKESLNTNHPLIRLAKLAKELSNNLEKVDKLVGKL